MDDSSLREHLTNLLRGHGAHVDPPTALKGLAVDLRGKRPARCPHSPWELLEHMRIAQWDMLEFCRDPKHVSPTWPEGYWPESKEPPNASAWTKSIRTYLGDMEEMCKLVADPATDLFARLPHGDGQTVLKEALQMADHNSYHLGQFLLVRKMLGAWK